MKKTQSALLAIALLCTASSVVASPTTYQEFKQLLDQTMECAAVGEAIFELRAEGMSVEQTLASELTTHQASSVKNLVKIIYSGGAKSSGDAGSIARASCMARISADRR